jgi:hypothetical protein
VDDIAVATAFSASSVAVVKAAAEVALEDAANICGCLEVDDADGTTRQDTAVDLPRTENTRSRRTHRTRAARPKTVAVSESQLHATVADLLKWVLRPPAFATTFPAGWGKLSKATAGRLYASGLQRGMPDILVFPGAGRCIGIELKAPGRYPTPVQRAMHAKLDKAGIKVYVCESVADVIGALNDAQVPFRYVHANEPQSRRMTRALGWR